MTATWRLYAAILKGAVLNLNQKILELFDKFDRGSFSSRNRFVRSATWLAGADDETGEMSKAEIARHAEIAAGGAGVVITGGAYVSRDGKSLPRQWGLDSDARIDDVAALAAAVHRSGSKLVVEICHSGGQRDTRVASPRPLSPSGGVHPGCDIESEPLSPEEIARIRSDFVASAMRAQKGGADAVEVHGGHGLLLTQFLSLLTNRRSDGYGGSFDNRMRIFCEILSDIRSALGERFPVWFKISIAEGVERGYKAEEGLRVAERLLREGVSGIEVSSGTMYAPAPNSPSVVGISAGGSEAPFREYAAELKRFASREQVIILTGGLRSLPVMAGLHAIEACDLFGMSRPFNAEPDLVNRWYEEDSRPSACISCNACLRTAEYGMVDCPVMRDRNEGFWDPL